MLVVLHEIINLGNQPLSHMIGVIEKVQWPLVETGDLSPGA